VTWNEARRRLKLRVPTRLASAGVLFEVPGSSDTAAADGEERVHGRWLMVAGTIGGREAALGIVNNGQPGFDFKDAEVRLSVLRSVAYCHEQGFDIDGLRAPGFTDIGVHHVRLLVTAGDPDRVRAMLPALADLVDAPPAAYAHLPFGVRSKATELLSLFAPGVRLLACKQSWDGQALIVRLQEASGRAALGLLRVAKPGRPSSSPRTPLPLSFRPFELKTLRIERAGDVRDVALIEER
jgi:alpha-mannosidase